MSKQYNIKFKIGALKIDVTGHVGSVGGSINARTNQLKLQLHMDGVLGYH